MTKKPQRDAEKTKEDLLCAAENEFSQKGFYGARIDEIARGAGVNKRMIYEYFTSKEGLYKAVLTRVYRRLCEREVGVLSENITPEEAIYKIIHMYFEFLNSNETFVHLVLWENLNEARYLKELSLLDIKEPTIELLRKVIEGGKKEGAFRREIDTDQVILSIMTYTFSYFSNRYTMSVLMHRDLKQEENLRARVKEVTDMFLSYLCKSSK